MKGVLLSMIPGNKGVVCRETLAELRDSTRKVFFEILPPSWILNWNESTNILLLKNGSEVLFKQLDDVKKQRSSWYGWFYIDQAEECKDEDFVDLLGRLRHPVIKRHGFITQNPDGHNWVWKRFKESPDDESEMIESTTLDNPHLPQDYVDSLMKLPKDWVDKFIYGSHEVKSGIILSEFSENLMVDPFIIPNHWIRGRGMDWGVDKPATRVKVAVDEEGCFYVYGTYSKRDLTPEEHAENLNDDDGNEQFAMTKMDSTTWRKTGTSKHPDKLNLARQFIKAGIKMTPATRDWNGSLLLLKTLMKQGKLKFVRGKCDNLLEEIKSWKWGRPTAGKNPTVGADHEIDAVRYIVYALFGRVADKIIQKKEVDVKKIYLPKPNKSVTLYDSVTGCPI